VLTKEREFQESPEMKNSYQDCCFLGNLNDVVLGEMQKYYFSFFPNREKEIYERPIPSCRRTQNR